MNYLVLPMDGTIKEYPLVNEIVIVAKYVNNLYKKIKFTKLLNNSADFRTEPRFGANNKLTASAQI